MAIVARAPAARMQSLLSQCGSLPQYSRLRGPEAGLAMVRGRAGGGGAPFNLGEMTVTRCAVRTEAGHVGHAYVAGRDEARAELAALVDALMQDADRAPQIECTVIAPLEAEQAAQRAERSRKAAATRVQFFAMQTMRT
ncbi:MAG: phosphonate C-P lyase system protein PhnG [Rhodospirillales bacterium 20-64-7]|nr:MAG: phosphonate C-P lyase system protein PhnG [Rhodospirillales bacterium 20-64-7]